LERHIVIRTDRIGDLILSLPVAEAIKDVRPDADVYYTVSPRVAEIARACPFVDGTIEYDETWKHPKHIQGLVREVKAIGAESAVFLRPAMTTAIAFLLAGVPLRVGTAYRYYSLLFNRRVRQHRRYADQHEADYNLSMLATLMEIKNRKYTPRIDLDPASVEFAADALTSRGLDKKDFVIVHPGSGGSARNLPTIKYAGLVDLIESSLRTGVLVTAGEEESQIISQINTYRQKESISLIGPPNLLCLAAVIKQARLFISGSTGPMHIAAAVGTPTLSFFSPVRSCSPTRWRPLGEKHVIVVPPVSRCPTCIGPECRHFDCMDLIDVGKLLGTLDDLLKS
jgi:heptosyltransferase-3